MSAKAHFQLDSQSGADTRLSSEPPAAGSVGGSPVSRSPINDRSHAPRRRCAYCDKPFVVYRNSIQKYCSHECSRKAHAPYRRVAFDYTMRGEERPIQDSLTAERAAPRLVELRRVRASDGKRYVGYDANALLEEISESEQARPGLLYG